MLKKIMVVAAGNVIAYAIVIAGTMYLQGPLTKWSIKNMAKTMDDIKF